MPGGEGSMVASGSRSLKPTRSGYRSRSVEEHHLYPMLSSAPNSPGRLGSTAALALSPSSPRLHAVARFSPAGSGAAMPRLLLAAGSGTIAGTGGDGGGGAVTSAAAGSSGGMRLLPSIHASLGVVAPILPSRQSLGGGSTPGSGTVSLSGSGAGYPPEHGRAARSYDGRGSGGGAGDGFLLSGQPEGASGRDGSRPRRLAIGPSLSHSRSLLSLGSQSVPASPVKR